MAGICPAPGADDPMVRGLLNVVDCNVQTLVQTGYSTLFQPTGAFSAVLTALLVCYVAFIGYALLLGRSQLNITEFALSAVKIGAVVALATRWSAYQALVYHLLFYGPEQIANVILHAMRANGSVLGEDVFDGLQRALGDLTAFSPATPPGGAAPSPSPGSLGGLTAAGAGQLSTLLSKAGFDSLLLLGSAVILLLSTLGVLLAAKIVLGVLLATGPIFIALLLFESTRGIFEGWLRAALAFAFAPLAVSLLLGLALTMLQPSLEQIELMRGANSYVPGVAFGVAVLVAVFASVTLGLVAAGGMIASGVRPPRRSQRTLDRDIAVSAAAGYDLARVSPSRAARTAQAVAAQERRDAAAARQAGLRAGSESAIGDRRTMSVTNSVSNRGEALNQATRLGQQPRRSASPRVARSGARAEVGTS